MTPPLVGEQVGETMPTRTDVTEPHKIPRDGWPPGPWDNEPDEDRFEAHGFPVLLLRGPLGNWCGYVAVPAGHPWHGRDYGVVGLGDDVDVHGGLTYSGACSERICHVPREGEPDGVWWVGFDCAHGMDVMPGMLATLQQIRGAEWDPASIYNYEQYRTVEYARAQAVALAEQALGAGKGAP